MVQGEASPHTSVCHTSKPDLVAFNYSRSKMMLIDVVGECGEDFVVKEKVKGLHTMITENKDDNNENTFQQLMGNVEGRQVFIMPK